jgi:hypothetical protein
MTDATRDDLADDDRLPWLEAVEEDEAGPSLGKLLAFVLLGILLIGLVVGGVYWLGTRGNGGGAGNGELITSPGEYKVRPENPGGMQLGNQATTQTATAEGAEGPASLNRAATPEAPVTQPQAQAQAQQPPQARPAQPQPQAAQPAPAPAQPRPQQQAARPAGPTIQVGAYPSEATANAEWGRLTQRYPYLRALGHRVEVYQRGGQTFYRLRASGGEASAVCRRLRAAGQPCMDVN